MMSEMIESGAHGGFGAPSSWIDFGSKTSTAEKPLSALLCLHRHHT